MSRSTDRPKGVPKGILHTTLESIPWPGLQSREHVVEALATCRIALETLTISEQAEVIRTLASERAL
jgi:hypothetical protein